MSVRRIVAVVAFTSAAPAMLPAPPTWSRSSRSANSADQLLTELMLRRRVDVTLDRVEAVLLDLLMEGVNQ